ncbi:MAG: aromatic acid exporter family protein [Bacillota bacterium]|uniref:Aromatic acid exporter family protein n=1 Tax=Virgibacillus salarius TaxID=447199 RepID=A0A941DWG6_9BACI|nr:MULTISPECIES: aromatic acid exporter family protein [Bacillaceae]NAZ09431.1 aromatic acid exporter family protein [Agaribacter marinus]MBR7796721.1 aromatic acid exporter family protein [Virgibacillus salarius]MCC2249160.1 aromatic acid exporter family protein [Virgibacillus sp. AGTR]MDY7043462.1 aromatic acid exporter family protein [Virgibacillus sp. M23]QRZ16934.1 aromatic acid exporter family protein [Virgibacillus sp. AGTR]
MKIGYRTIKTAIGTPIAIWIAQLLGVTNFVSAGILTILCIQPSRKQSFLSAWNRFLACIIASILSILFFHYIGYHPAVVGLLLAIFIPITVYLNITQGIATSSVIILNLYGAHYLDYDFLVDQFLLIIIGIGTGLLLNLYMPSLDKKLKEKQRELEENFQSVLYEIALYVRNRNIVWDGNEITRIEQLLVEAADLVERDKENHILRNKHPYRDYFRMRSRQFELLQRMLPLVTKLPKKDSITEKIASFFEGLSKAVHPGNTAIIYLEELEQLRKDFDREDLPCSREEFETRANLFRLLHDIEDYLLLKKRFKESDVRPKRRTSKEA